MGYSIEKIRTSFAQQAASRRDFEADGPRRGRRLFNSFRVSMFLSCVYLGLAQLDNRQSRANRAVDRAVIISFDSAGF
jgi:hypothetical protein